MKTILGLLIVCMGNMAMANDFAATVGFRSNSADSVAAGYSSTAKTSYGLGVKGFFDMQSNLQFRTGFIYNQRSYKLSTTGVDVDLNLAYVDIPVTLMYKFAEYGGAFAGPVASLMVSKECKLSISGTCSTKDPDAFVLGYEFGVMFKFAPQMGIELYYEMIPTEFWKDSLKNSRIVGVNFLYTFE
jgi:hypothetical protein